MVKKRTTKTVIASKATTKTAIAATAPIINKSVAISKPKMASGKKAIAPVATTTLKSMPKKATSIVAKPAVKIVSKTTAKTATIAPKMMSGKTSTKKTVRK